MKKPFILFITGISASGKTTLYEELKKIKELEKTVRFHDIDENGVPPYGRTHWRPFRVEELLSEAIKNFSQGLSTVIVGITQPEEVFSSKQYTQELNVNFLLVEVEFEEFRNRIENRLKKSNDKSLEADLQSVVVANQDLAKKLHNNVNALKNGYTINSSKLSIDEMTKKVLELVNN